MKFEVLLDEAGESVDVTFESDGEACKVCMR